MCKKFRIKWNYPYGEDFYVRFANNSHGYEWVNIFESSVVDKVYLDYWFSKYNDSTDSFEEVK